MKYLRTYEKLDEPQIGDYVVCMEELSSDKDSLSVIKFLTNNVGQFIIKNDNSIFKFFYLIKFENVPKRLSGKFFDGSKGCRRMSRDEILYFSKDKEDCEIFINAKKYNL